MLRIGMRLRDERIRLNYLQKDFAAIGGVMANAQSKYEHGQRSPSALYLAKLAEIGVDVLYVLTGTYSSACDQGDLNLLFRKLTLCERQVVTELMKSFAKRACPHDLRAV
ncbi:MAG: XRE family transcriptional regulator [Proteobacteria bacterium]|nr:MAG: XRE family transcriptional regulator [Pseudomonadota bacterium]